MSVDRRQFVLGLGAASAAAAAKPTEQFLWPRQETYLNSAGMHPLSVAGRRAIDRCLDYLTEGPGDGRERIGEQHAAEVKRLYAKLIGAEADEIAFIQSTQVGENIVTDGLGLPERGGNIVTDEMHFHGGLYHLGELAKQGVELRVVKQRDWQVSLDDLDAAIDRETRLVALTLVSNLNGFQHDARAVSDLAHAKGAYFYADIIQAAGCVPLDMQAMGVDFAAAATFKWLMGLHGFGYLYVKKELQGNVLGTRRYGDRHYRNFQYDGGPSWDLREGAARYEIGSFSDVAVACQLESLRYLNERGVDSLQKQVEPLTRRILEELPRLGYERITPTGSQAPIAGFLVPDEDAVRAKLAAGKVNAKVKWGQLRISPSLFNTQDDVDRLLAALDA